MAEVRLADVSKYFSRRLSGPYAEEHAERETIVALNHLNLMVQDGETLSVVGPSGCGKTTLLRIIAGLERPDAGTVYFDGRDVTSLSARDRGIGMVFQSYALYPHMSSAENLAFYFRVRRREEEIPERVRVTAQILGVGFEQLLGRMPRNLSGACLEISRRGNVSGLPSDGASCEIRVFSCLMNLWPISMPSCALKRAWR